MSTSLNSIWEEAAAAQDAADHHLYSASDDGLVTPLQASRQKWRPILPKVYDSSSVTVQEISADDLITPTDMQSCSSMDLSVEQENILKGQFPNIYNTPCFSIVEDASKEASAPINIGVVLSGGQAAGGHNVISGIFDFIKSKNPESKLFGFLCGPHGVYSHKYEEISAEKMMAYRNMGGFDIIRSGRHKIETDEQKQKSLEICQKLSLSGLVVIGGDDSNTNAAILAEYFKSQGSTISVIGCPKTIDGDLKNLFVEISFGFDTAVKTYCESIGNLMMDAATCGGVYHFIRLMGRSASIITLECALQTHPNLTFIGEEVQLKQLPLKSLVNEIADLVIKRAESGKDYGVVCLPEGLIEFIPEVGILIGEINSIVAKGEFSESLLSAESLGVFKSLPQSTRDQLLLDRDPHGNVQVAMIATERLLMQMAKEELKKRNFSGSFHPQSHYFGYEGRSGLPSGFDSTYCYALGYGAGVLVQRKATACMSILKNMSKSWDSREWKPAGIPLTKMMTLERRKGKDNVPVIKKFLVDTEKPLFKLFEEVRDTWKLNDFYSSPGCAQFTGSASHERTYTLLGAPEKKTLVPSVSKNENDGRPFKMTMMQMSVLQKQRVESPISINSDMENKNCDISESSAMVNSVDKSIFSYSLKSFKSDSPSGFCNFTTSSEGKACNVGLVFMGKLFPGVSNILLGLEKSVSETGGKVFGFFGAEGLLNKKYKQLTTEDMSLIKNQGGFTVLGRTSQQESTLGTEQGMKDAVSTCSHLKLDALVVIGWTFLNTATLEEYFLRSNCGVKIFGVNATCASPEFPVDGPLDYLKSCCGKDIGFFAKDNEAKTTFLQDADGCLSLGFDTMAKCQSQLVGNLLTDSASAVKYFYFCLVGGGKGAELEVMLQTHANICLATSELKHKSLDEIVSFVAAQVKQRSESGKNYGCLVMNEDLFHKNDQMSILSIELDEYLTKNECRNIHIKEGEGLPGDLRSSLSPKSIEVFEMFPTNFQQQLLSLKRKGKTLSMMDFPAHELIASLVSRKLKEVPFNGSFSPVSFSLISQVRAALPSPFDCSLGMTLGYIAGICARKEKSSSFIFVANPTDAPTKWKPYLIPLAVGGMEAHGLGVDDGKMTSVPKRREWQAGEGGGEFMCKMLTENILSKKRENWAEKDAYCNPGPIQYEGNFIAYYNRSVYERQKKLRLV